MEGSFLGIQVLPGCGGHTGHLGQLMMVLKCTAGATLFPLTLQLSLKNGKYGGREGVMVQECSSCTPWQNSPWPNSVPRNVNTFVAEEQWVSGGKQKVTQWDRET